MGQPGDSGDWNPRDGGTSKFFSFDKRRSTEMTETAGQVVEVPALQAAAAVVTAAQTAFATIFNGDPATAGARAVAALPVFLGQAELAALGGANSEFAAVGTLAQTGFAALLAKINAQISAAQASSSTPPASGTAA